MNLRRAIVVLGVGLFLSMSSTVGAGLDERINWPDCRVSQLTIANGFQISPYTGQNPLTLRLTNRAQRSCILYGYPTIAFTDARGSIPFPIKLGGDQMINRRPPTRVVVRAGRSAFVLVNKFRCDLGAVRVARTLLLGLPGHKSPQLSLTLPAYPRITYCGKGNPQSTVMTSAFVPSIRAALWS